MSGNQSTLSTGFAGWQQAEWVKACRRLIEAGERPGKVFLGRTLWKQWARAGCSTLSFPAWHKGADAGTALATNDPHVTVWPSYLLADDGYVIEPETAADRADEAWLHAPLTDEERAAFEAADANEPEES